MNQEDNNKSPDTTQENAELNENYIDLYFDFLSRGAAETDIFSGMWLDASGKAPINLPGQKLGIWHSNLAEIKQKYRELVALGVEFPTFHVTLNGTNLAGRQTKHIQSVRVFCCDIDRKITRKELIELRDAFAPGLIVESSPGKYHLYWSAVSGVKLDEWKDIQAGLAAIMDGDLNLSQVSHTIRVPGFPRLTKDGIPWCPKVISYNPEPIIWTPELWHQKAPTMLEQGKLCLEERRAKRAKVHRSGAKLDWAELEAQAKQTSDGKRNDQLYSVVFSYAQNGNGEITEESCLEVGKRVNEGFPIPLGDDEVAKTVRSGFERGIEARHEKETKRQNLLKALSPDEITQKELFKYDYENKVFKDNKFTDEAVAERVMQRFGDRILNTGKAVYCFESRKKIWSAQKQDKSALFDLVKECSKDTIHDPAFGPDLCCDPRGNPSKDKARQWQRHFMSYRTQQSIVQQVLQRKDFKEIDQEKFDSQVGLFYAHNGVMNLADGGCREALPEDYLLHQSRVEYIPEAKCPWWENFIEEIFAENQAPLEMTSFLQELFGYSLSGSIDEQKIFIHYGGGSNGKSKVLLALNLLLGDYGALMGSSTLAKKKQPIDQELQRVGVKAEGKRTLIIDDVDTKSQWNESIVKNFTGPFLPIRRLYEEERDIPNRAKFHLGCNEAPKPESENYGILRRLCIIPYVRTFIPSPEKEKEIVLKIREELSGILNWAAEGYRRKFTRGYIVYPNEVLLSIEEYRIEHFTIEQLCLAIFTETDGSDKDWYELNDLVNLVNQKLVEAGKASEKLSGDSLGRILKRLFKAPSKRIGPNKVNTYNIKLLPISKQSLLSKIEQT